MRRLSALNIPEIQRALDDLQRQINALREDFGEMAIPTEEARVPIGREARVWFDEAEGKFKILTRTGLHEWSED